jgi:phenylpyruvate tautomerase PptA (4-oxalocrotonate tautomerase family)
MRSYENEDMAWQRLQDIQREAENRRLVEAGGPPDEGGLAGLIAEITWSFVHALGLKRRRTEVIAVEPPGQDWQASGRWTPGDGRGEPGLPAGD